MNINGFAGIGDVTKGPYDKQEEILKRILEVSDIDIILLSEFNLKIENNERFHNDLIQKGYKVVYPNNIKNKQELKYKDTFVIAFTKESANSDENVWLRWNEIFYKGYRIVGVHVPSSEIRNKDAIEFWNIMIAHYNKYKEGKVIYIGDMNVFKEGTDGRKLQQELLNNGVIIDAWIKKGGVLMTMKKI